MTRLHARRLDVPADPLAVARVLAAEPGFAFLGTAAASDEPSYVACRPVARSAALDPEPSLGLLPDAGLLAATPRWVGLLPYEAFRGLERAAWTRSPDLRAGAHLHEPVWLRYGAVVRIARGEVLVVGDDSSAVNDLARTVALSMKRGAPAAVRGEVHAEPTRTREGEPAHRARIERALELIVEGQIYQVNLARRFTFRVAGQALAILERLAGRAGAEHAAAFEVDGLRVAAASPELLLEVTPRGALLTRPIKGTRPRGADARADRALREELEGDEKERAELAMVVDVERNDLGRVAVTGSVRVLGPPEVRTFGSVHHRVARVAARLRPGVSREELLRSFAPSGSVTGAPKVRAMEVIAALEPERRGLYTGGFGALSHDGALRLGMAIRVVTVRDGEGHYFAGGGIVYGSDPDREVAETRWKARAVLEMLGEGR